MRSQKHSSQKGSVLLVALLLSAGIAIALGSYVNLGLTSMKLANRSFYANSSINLAEAGIEEAMIALNENDFTDWTVNGGTQVAKRTFTGFSLGAGATGSVRVAIQQLGSSTPRATAEGRSTLADGTVISKQVQARLYRRSRFANGLVARSSVTFSGNTASVDSYNSSAGAYDVSTNRNDGGTVGSLSVSVDAVDVQNADIWGFVATGGAAPAVGPNGTVRGEETANGTDVDSSRIATDFAANLEPAEVPSSGYTSYGTITTSDTLGTAGTTTMLEVDAISLASSNALVINGNVILKVTSTGTAINLAGTSLIRITPDSSLTIYVEGSCNFAGNGIVNENTPPSTCQIYGTNATEGAQTLSFSGNSDLKAAVYAPNAAIAITGSADTYGSFVGYDVNLGGSARFHYDEALGAMGGSNPFAVSLWRELTSQAEKLDIPAL